MAGASTALVALAALCWGVSGGVGGILMAEGWDAFVVSFYRGAIGMLFVLVWLALRPGGSGLASRRPWLWSLMGGGSLLYLRRAGQLDFALQLKDEIAYHPALFGGDLIELVYDRFQAAGGC